MNIEGKKSVVIQLYGIILQKYNDRQHDEGI